MYVCLSIHRSHRRAVGPSCRSHIHTQHTHACADMELTAEERERREVKRKILEMAREREKAEGEGGEHQGYRMPEVRGLDILCVCVCVCIYIFDGVGAGEGRGDEGEGGEHQGYRMPEMRVLGGWGGGWIDWLIDLVDGLTWLDCLDENIHRPHTHPTR